MLGRHGGVGGRYRGRLDVIVDGEPLLAHTTLLDGADPALCGPGGTAGARAVGTLVVVDAACPAAPETLVRGATRRAVGVDGPGRAGRGRCSPSATPGAVIALLDAAVTTSDGRRQPGMIRRRSRSNGSVSTTRWSATIAARYSSQSGCSPAMVR